MAKQEITQAEFNALENVLTDSQIYINQQVNQFSNNRTLIAYLRGMKDYTGTLINLYKALGQ